MDEVCVFVKYNGQWDGILRYVGGEMKGILVPETATYVGLIEIQCDADIKFYIQLKKKDVHVLSKCPITIDVLDESATEARPPEVGKSNHIDVQHSREGVQSDEAMQHVDDSNLIILPPPPHITSPTIDLDLHTESGIEKQHQILNNDLCTTRGDCNARELNVADYARHPNENSIAASIGAHYIANNTTSQSVNVPSSDSVSDSVVVADYTPVTMRRNCIFENKKLLQYHLHHDAMSKHNQFKVKRSNSTLLHVICIDNEGCPWQLCATKMRGSELFVVKRYDDDHTCLIEIVQGHHRQANSWMIGECVKAKYLDPTNTSYRPREKMRDMQAEFEVSFNYLRSWRGKEAALTSLRVMMQSHTMAKFEGMLLAACGHDANGSIFPLAFGIVPHKGIEYVANLVYPDAAFGICVQHLAANLKTRYKDFKGPLKTYFDGASRSYLLNEHHRHMVSIRSRNLDMHRYLVQADPTKWSRAYFNGRRYAIMTTNIAESLNNVDWKARLMPVGFLVEWLREPLERWFVERREEALKITLKLAPKAEKLIRTNFSLGLTITPRSADQFEYTVTNNAAQIWIVDMSKRIFHPIGCAEGWDVFEEVRSQIVNPPNTKRRPGRPRVRRILSQGEEHEHICNLVSHGITKTGHMRVRHLKPLASMSHPLSLHTQAPRAGHNEEPPQGSNTWIRFGEQHL
ncbi:hypothetical protein TIFTF001_032790 [Ficus carica]|uniref:Transposase MuDR plant domain-containing protein n=1 Tax=Ficus carica TaxID=3494 RepID=A0AA88DWZ9_FICCA|nr:hypothetical protein TIFTF001_032790 [Ficus carica]